VNVKGSYTFADFMILETQDDGEMLLILVWPFLWDVSARIDVGAGKNEFRIDWRNMTFKFQA
jgi:hypothetical protein